MRPSKSLPSAAPLLGVLESLLLILTCGFRVWGLGVLAAFGKRGFIRVSYRVSTILHDSHGAFSGCKGA